jgi:hypothetical protein
LALHVPGYGEQVEFDLSDRVEPFTPGETVAVVEVMNGKVWTVRPVTVVVDAADEIALWLAPGTITRYPSGPQHGEHTVRQWMTGEWQLRDRRWDPPGTLRLTRPGDAFDVWASPGMHDVGTPWYVNLQDPLRRVGAGFTTMVHLLDLLVSPDLDSWEWKDEREFELAQEAGPLSSSRAAEIRAVGLGVVTALQAGHAPWDVSWATWTPPEP